jgi:hypothetical protein
MTCAEAMDDGGENVERGGGGGQGRRANGAVSPAFRQPCSGSPAIGPHDLSSLSRRTPVEEAGRRSVGRRQGGLKQVKDVLGGLSTKESAPGSRRRRGRRRLRAKEPTGSSSRHGRLSRLRPGSGRTEEPAAGRARPGRRCRSGRAKEGRGGGLRSGCRCRCGRWGGRTEKGGRRGEGSGSRGLGWLGGGAKEARWGGCAARSRRSMRISQSSTLAAGARGTERRRAGWKGRTPPPPVLAPERQRATSPACSERRRQRATTRQPLGSRCRHRRRRQRGRAQRVQGSCPSKMLPVR